MKRIFLFLLFISIHGSGYSQSLTLDELISLRQKDVGDITEYLIKKGWVYETSESKTSSFQGTDWKYKSKSSGKTLARLTLFEGSNEVFITYQTGELKYYNILSSRIKEFKMKKVRSEHYDQNNSILTDYEGAKYIVSTEIIPDNGGNVYMVSLRLK